MESRRHIVDLDMATTPNKADSEQPAEAHLHWLPTEIRLSIFKQISPKMLGGSLSQSCMLFSSDCQQTVEEEALKTLWQAVIDDNKGLVRTILNGNAYRLLKNAPSGCTITSKYTWQKFDIEGETALSIAVKRKQIEMIKILIAYTDKIDQTKENNDAIQNALSKWSHYQTERIDELDDNDASVIREVIFRFCYGDRPDIYPQEIFFIPPAYRLYVQSLIDAFSTELFPNGADNINAQLSNPTETALQMMRENSLPNISKKNR